MDKLAGMKFEDVVRLLSPNWTEGMGIAQTARSLREVEGIEADEDTIRFVFGGFSNQRQHFMFVMKCAREGKSYAEYQEALRKTRLGWHGLYTREDYLARVEQVVIIDAFNAGVSYEKYISKLNDRLACEMGISAEAYRAERGTYNGIMEAMS